MFRVLLFLSCLAWRAPFAGAEFNLRPGLTADDRARLTRILGLGTISKNVTVPAPLGTDNGLEISIATELIDTSKVSSLLSKPDDTLVYPKILIGKGLYQTTDIYFHFTPYTATLGLSEFGGMVRYNFYHSQKSPFTAAMVVHANSANFNNQMTSRDLGADLYLGLGWKYISFYAGGGWANSHGKFTGGAQGVTNSLLDETNQVDATHYGAGAQLNFSILTLALGFDYYYEPVYTLKLGVML